MSSTAMPACLRRPGCRRVTFVAVAISFAQAWLRLKTGSVWPPIFLHASHNLWMQSVFTPLTTERENTKWVAGDLGVAFVVVAAVVAVVFWSKRGELKPTAARDDRASTDEIVREVG